MSALLQLLHLARPLQFPTEDNVIVLDDSNFAEAINEFDTLLVEFYAPVSTVLSQLAAESALARPAPL